MTDIHLWNTRARAKERLAPLDPENVRMYVCGPTVYDRAHIGNARPAVVFDVLFRLLRHTYGAEHVTYVRNITDVDDKINARAASSGRSIREITDETTGWYHEDMDALGVLRPTFEPRATEYVPQMVAMIETLVTKGHAYEVEGHVLFAVASYPEYGALARRSLDDMRAGARVEVAPYKRDPMDFVLWKPSVAGEPGWESPWGFGRPGWHIECSAMAFELLGASFDIHGGGIDLAFPHHENELAQSRCAHPEGMFANIWMHNGFLNVEGEKMSKSLGNFFTMRDLLDKGIPGEVIRFVLLSTHYRRPIDWNERKITEAKATLSKWRMLTEGTEPHGSPDPEILEALRDDLNMPQAIARFHALAAAGDGALLKASSQIVGLLTKDLGGWIHHFRPSAISTGAPTVGSPTLQQTHDLQATDLITGEATLGVPTLQQRIQLLIDARDAARAARNFDQADSIRDILVAAGVVVMDRPGAPTDWETGPDFNPSRLVGIEV